VYLRTVALSTSQADSLEGAIAIAPFRVKQIGTKHVPDGPVRGEVRLVRGADNSAQLDSLVAWLRHQPQIVAADRDSTVVFR